MHEFLTFDHAFLGIVIIEHSVDRAQVDIGITHRARRIFAGIGCRTHHAAGRIWVGAGPFRHGMAIQPGNTRVDGGLQCQRIEHRRHCQRIIASLAEIFDAKVVGLFFLAARIFEREYLRQSAGIFAGDAAQRPG